MPKLCYNPEITRMHRLCEKVEGLNEVRARLAEEGHPF